MIRSKPSNKEYRRRYDEIEWDHSAGVAQKVEFLTCNQDVTGSIPVTGSREINEEER
jgi:hypothetical protein